MEAPLGFIEILFYVKHLPKLDYTTRYIIVKPNNQHRINDNYTWCNQF